MLGPESLKGEVALVTGASRGIGRAIAVELAGLGATVVGTATTQAGADTVTGVIAEAGGDGEGRILDVTEAEGVERLVKGVTDDHGAPTVLVNNAGVTRDNLIMRMKDEEWEAILATHLTGAYRLARACVRGMVKARRGRIINIGSVVGATGNAGQANYAAAKAGVVGLTKSLARELGGRGITANTVAPGFIDTDMTRRMSDAQRQALLGQIPLERLGVAEEVAAAVAFLASPRAGYITGETLHVNGGMHMA